MTFLPFLSQREDQSLISQSPALVRVAGHIDLSVEQNDTAASILMDEPVLRTAQAHVLCDLEHEVGGFLIGNQPQQLANGRYLVHIFDAFVAEHAISRKSSLTFTPETWRALRDRLSAQYGETAVCLGWFHSHPGYSVFLSDHDLFLHKNYFTQPWHTAFVLDPCAKRSGFFCWDKNQTELRPFHLHWPSWAKDSW